MAGKIFINYRRGDEPGFAQALLGRLEQAFPADRLFIDVDNIPPGEDFIRVIELQVVQCDVLLAMIGKSWLGAKDEDGGRRLDDPNDFVRIEIESALRQGKRVIPVLVHDARMPRSDELPEAIRPLATRNAVRLTHERFRADVQGLVRALEKALDEMDVPRLRRERDDALQQLEAVKVQLENSEYERSIQAKRIEELSQQNHVIENDERRLRDEPAKTRQQAMGLNHTPTREGTTSQPEPMAQKPITKLRATEVDLFRTATGYAVQLNRNTALVQNYEKFYILPSLADFRQKYAGNEMWIEVMDRDEKRKFFTAAQQAYRTADKRCPALEAIDVDR